MKFTLDEVLKSNGYTVKDIPDSVKANLIDLLERVNKLGYPRPATCNSAYRDPVRNAKIGGAKRSAHCQGKAIDISDRDGKLKQWIMEHDYLLEQLGLRMEAISSTPTWCHLDTMPVKHARVFLP